MREVLHGITLHVNGGAVSSSTTAGSVGADVFALSSAVAELALTLTTSCLIGDNAEIAITQRHTSRLGQQFNHRVHHTDPLGHRSIAGACLLEHAASLRELVNAHVALEAHVAVDVDPGALDRVTLTWTSIR